MTTGHVFVVGCPRSGTTLLQTLLAGHPDVISFPETFFFPRVVGSSRVRRRLGIAGPDARPTLDRVNELLGGTRPVRAGGITVGAYARAFTALADAAAAEQGAKAWVEKTPQHIRWIATIERHVDDPLIVHVIRDGPATVASLVDVTRRYPERWGGERSAEACLARWREDLRRSYECRGRSGHLFVAYESLVREAGSVLDRLFNGLGLTADGQSIERLLAARGDRLPSLTRSEPWKGTVAGPLENRNAAKVAAVLSTEERELVQEAAREDRHLLEALPVL